MCRTFLYLNFLTLELWPVTYKGGEAEKVLGERHRRESRLHVQLYIFLHSRGLP